MSSALQWFTTKHALFLLNLSIPALPLLVMVESLVSIHLVNCSIHHVAVSPWFCYWTIAVWFSLMFLVINHTIIMFGVSIAHNKMPSFLSIGTMLLVCTWIVSIAFYLIVLKLLIVH